MSETTTITKRSTKQDQQQNELESTTHAPWRKTEISKDRRESSSPPSDRKPLSEVPWRRRSQSEDRCRQLPPPTAEGGVIEISEAKILKKVKPEGKEERENILKVALKPVSKHRADSQERQPTAEQIPWKAAADTLKKRPIYKTSVSDTVPEMNHPPKIQTLKKITTKENSPTKQTQSIAPKASENVPWKSGIGSLQKKPNSESVAIHQEIAPIFSSDESSVETSLTGDDESKPSVYEQAMTPEEDASTSEQWEQDNSVEIVKKTYPAKKFAQTKEEPSPEMLFKRTPQKPKPLQPESTGIELKKVKPRDDKRPPTPTGFSLKPIPGKPVKDDTGTFTDKGIKFKPTPIKQSEFEIEKMKQPDDDKDVGSGNFVYDSTTTMQKKELRIEQEINGGNRETEPTKKIGAKDDLADRQKDKGILQSKDVKHFTDDSEILRHEVEEIIIPEIPSEMKQGEERRLKPSKKKFQSKPNESIVKEAGTVLEAITPFEQEQLETTEKITEISTPITETEIAQEEQDGNVQEKVVAKAVPTYRKQLSEQVIGLRPAFHKPEIAREKVEDTKLERATAETTPTKQNMERLDKSQTHKPDIVEEKEIVQKKTTQIAVAETTPWRKQPAEKVAEFQTSIPTTVVAQENIEIKKSGHAIFEATPSMRNQPVEQATELRTATPELEKARTFLQRKITQRAIADVTPWRKQTVEDIIELQTSVPKPEAVQEIAEIKTTEQAITEVTPAVIKQTAEPVQQAIPLQRTKSKINIEQVIKQQIHAPELENVREIIEKKANERVVTEVTPSWRKQKVEKVVEFQTNILKAEAVQEIIEREPTVKAITGGRASVMKQPVEQAAELQTRKYEMEKAQVIPEEKIAEKVLAEITPSWRKQPVEKVVEFQTQVPKTEVAQLNVEMKTTSKAIPEATPSWRRQPVEKVVEFPTEVPKTEVAQLNVEMKTTSIAIPEATPSIRKQNVEQTIQLNTSKPESEKAMEIVQEKTTEKAVTEITPSWRKQTIEKSVVFETPVPEPEVAREKVEIRTTAKAISQVTPSMREQVMKQTTELEISTPKPQLPQEAVKRKTNKELKVVSVELKKPVQIESVPETTAVMQAVLQTTTTTEKQVVIQKSDLRPVDVVELDVTQVTQHEPNEPATPTLAKSVFHQVLSSQSTSSPKDVKEKVPQPSPKEDDTKRGKKKASLTTGPRYIAPIFVKKLQSLTSRTGKIVRFHCQFEGLPTPTITWYRNQFVLNTSGRIKVTVENGTATLEIKNVEDTDSGLYTCRAVNDAGSATTTANMIVIGKAILTINHLIKTLSNTK